MFYISLNKEAMRILPSYESKSKVKLVIILLALAVAVGSVFYTQTLVQKLAEREQKQIDLHAAALEFIANSEPNENISFLFNEIIESNHSIPVILTDADTAIINSRNILEPDWPEDKKETILNEELAQMIEHHQPIVVEISEGFKNYIWYRNSDMLTRLKWYPYIQLGTIAILILSGYLAFSYFRTAEQDRIWAGMAKETAHQLGTPLSSLMAWVEYLRETEMKPSPEILDELDKDIQRLQLVAGRFSQIGSKPVLKEESATEALSELLAYLKPRVSNKIQINKEVYHQHDLLPINKPLFQWVVENLIKNAIDAIEGQGSITLITQETEAGKFALDIKDTGKGMSSKEAGNIFNPGFTTKKRGWGLGLTLAKRIIEEYHKGRLFIKATEQGKGTTFRITLPLKKKDEE